VVKEETQKLVEELAQPIEESTQPPKKKSKWKKHLFWGFFIVSILSVLAFTLYSDLSNPAELSATMYHEFRKHWW